MKNKLARKGGEATHFHEDLLGFTVPTNSCNSVAIKSASYVRHRPGVILKCSLILFR